MLKAVVFAFLFMLVVLGAFLWIGHSVTNMVGGGKKVVSAVEITPEGGETIFWGKGRCFTCHSVGGRGSAVRGPNQGVFGEKFQEPIGLRAESRARERSEQTGEEYSVTDYLVESLAVPGAYVVNGYKNEMAIVYAPPISLSLKEVKAVITYLQSQGGEPDIEALNNPSEISGKYIARIQAASAAGGGDPGAGAIVFEDNCMECHMIKGEGEEIGPDLSAISAEGLKFISESILEPSKHIEEGFETFEVIDLEGRKTTGLKTRDDAEEVDITKANGEVVTIAKSEIKEINTGDLPSIMPNDLIEALTVKDYQDVLSYLIMQKGE
ncbi:MAG: c-type cytochrome [Rhodospirillaceae bacterium]|jgi:putative heme-binding domain-containing protein|nr:c-type cytochrome [Rhodospirillaceae bacterium]MBT5677154.1 c-type cytochrome [Rhodospirillaceae bacterium]MBT5780290.1 c-type cytochrome [Rhodospirillaceae bacterium]MBT7290940.1 c-type cytochrome [Rhodospirillaceae bacterium]